MPILPLVRFTPSVFFAAILTADTTLSRFSDGADVVVVHISAHVGQGEDAALLEHLSKEGLVGEREAGREGWRERGGEGEGFGGTG